MRSSLECNRLALMRWEYFECRYRILELESPQKTTREYSESSISSTGISSKAEVSVCPNISSLLYYTVTIMGLIIYVVGGSRLGLWISRKIIHMHQVGAIVIYSVLERYSYVHKHFRVTWGLSPVDKDWVPLSTSSCPSIVPPVLVSTRPRRPHNYFRRPGRIGTSLLKAAFRHFYPRSRAAHRISGQVYLSMPMAILVEKSRITVSSCRPRLPELSSATFLRFFHLVRFLFSLFIPSILIIIVCNYFY